MLNTALSPLELLLVAEEARADARLTFAEHLASLPAVRTDDGRWPLVGWEMRAFAELTYDYDDCFDAALAEEMMVDAGWSLLSDG